MNTFQVAALFEMEYLSKSINDIKLKQMEKMKIAVIGFGFMGITHTINVLKNPGLELVAIVDKNPENIRKEYK